jgi:hypothetical protein
VLRLDQAIDPDQPVFVEVIVGDGRHVAVPHRIIEIVEHDPD